MRIDVTPPRLDASFEDPATLIVDIYNASDIIQGFTVEVDGLPPGAWRAEPSPISLFPEARDTVVITVTVPQRFPAGAHVLHVRVLATTDMSVVRTVEVVLDVKAYREARVALTPQSVTGRARATFVATVHNDGNVPLGLRLHGSDQEGALRFDVADEAVFVEPGQEAALPVAVRGRRPLVGTPKTRMLTVGVSDGQPDGITTAALATFAQKPWVPRSVLIVAAVLVPVAVLAFVLTRAVGTVVDSAAEQEQARVAAGQAAEAAASAAIVNAEPGSIQGLVLAGDAPADDAAVRLVVAASDPVERGREVGDVVAHAGTGPDGTYTLPDVTTPASYQVVFTREGFAQEAVEVELGVGEARSGIDAVLRSLDGAISGVVLGEEGPVGGATVTATDGLNQAETTTVTDGDDVGAFTIGDLPTPGTYALSASAPGTLTLATSVTLEAGEQLTDVVLSLPTHLQRVSGTVRDPDGEPLGEVAVTAHPAPDAAGPAAAEQATAPGPGPLATTATAADDAVGTYALQLPAPARYELRFERPGYVPATRLVGLTAEEEAGEVDVVLAPRNATVTGTVTIVDRPGACPAPPCLVGDTEVVATRGGEERATRTATAPAGAYVFEDLPPGTWTLRVAGTDRLAPMTVLVELQPGALVSADVALEGVPGTVTVVPTGSPGLLPSGSCGEVALRDAEGAALPAHPDRPLDRQTEFTGLRTPDGYTVTVGDDEPIPVVLAPGGRHTVEVACDP